jgi:hypothetical protein
MVCLQVSQSMKEDVQHDTRKLMSDNDVRIRLLDDEKEMIE